MDVAHAQTALPSSRAAWRFGIRHKMWATFTIIALMVIGTSLFSWSGYRETDKSMTRIVRQTLPLMTHLSELAQMAQKMVGLTPTILMATDIAGIEHAAATLAQAQLRFSTAVAQLDGEPALQADIKLIRAASTRIDGSLALLLSAQRQRIRLSASFAAISDQVDVLHQEYRLLSSSLDADHPKAKQFLLFANRFLVGLSEIGRIDNHEDLDSLADRLHPALNRMRFLLQQPEMMLSHQGAERIVARLDSITFSEMSLFSLRSREITTHAIAAQRLAEIRTSTRDLENTINRLVQQTEKQALAEQEETTRKLDQSQTLLLVLGVGSVLGSLVLASLFLGRSVLDRLNRLGATMRLIAAGDLETPIDICSRDELGDMARDVSVFRDAMAKINHIAVHDVLTGLGNRAMLEAQITRQVTAEKNGILLYFNLGGFRDIVETFGHATGDHVLCILADRLSTSIRPGDIAVRIGGERFVVAAPHLMYEADIRGFAARLISALRSPILIEELDLEIDPFVGIARYPQDGVTSEPLLHHADLAMRAGLENRSDLAASLYRTDMGDAARHRQEIRKDLKVAIERGDFMLHFQPKMRIRTGRIEGAEALVRWKHPERGTISPADFIPMAESSGLILPLGRWVLTESCRQAKTWQDTGHGPLQVAVNISPIQFLRDDMVEVVRQALDETLLPPECLELEITEGVLLHHEGQVPTRMQHLRDMGVKLAIDDFGTGYSSLSYLKKLPVNTLKIDQSFVRNIEPDNDDARICRAIIGLAHDIGLEVVAEGIEWQNHVDFLHSESCDLGQGYYISSPLAAADVLPFFDNWRAERLALRTVVV